MRWVIALMLGILALPCDASAQAPAADDEAPVSRDAAPDDGGSSAQAPSELTLWRGAPEPPIYETWWFWTAIGAVVVGVTLAIVIGVTTEHPRSSRAGLVLAF